MSRGKRDAAPPVQADAWRTSKEQSPPLTLQNVLRFYIDKLARDLEESVLTRQLIARLVSYNFPPGTPCPTFRLGRLDDGKLAAVGHMIAELVNGNVLAPDEPWIRDYLGLPAQTTGA